MSKPKNKRAAPAPGSLRRRKWKRFLRGPDHTLLDELYVPALKDAIRYDRCCSYFSSSVLASAARGFAGLIERLIALGNKAPLPAVRLVVNEELSAEDVRAMTESGDTSALEEALKRRFKTPKDALEKDRLAMLGLLVKYGLLQVRVGVMRHGEGVVHAKFGIITDARGDAIVFSGSGNESASGLQANYERLEVSESWIDRERHREYEKEFAALWKDVHPDVHAVTLPEALRLKLIKFARPEPPTKEPSNALARQKAAMLWQFITEAPYLPNGATACDATAMVDVWPHQQRVVEEASHAWPEGRLLCDEVGMGKTIEAILVLRRLLAGRGVKRALLLLPAGLTKQWQAELREKGGMIFPRLEGINTLVWPDDRTQKVSGLAEALKQDVLLMSRETARTENNVPILLAAEPWDLVLLDEAHAARRKKQEEGEFNAGTLLLDLLRQMQLRREARGFLLLSATPMQTHPWEAWDLLSVLGEGGAWLAEFGLVRRYYQALMPVQRGLCDLATARKAAALISADPEFPEPPVPKVRKSNIDDVVQLIAFPPPAKREEIARWLRQGSPLARRMHRNTRAALRQYYEMELLPDPPPVRSVEDIAFDFEDKAERDVYDAVARYIEKRFKELEQEKPGKGFVMTVYRRRASSSPLALGRSLERRRDGLQRVVEQRASDALLSEQDAPELVDVEDLPEGEEHEKISSALPQDPQVARAELAEVNRLLDQLAALRGRDSKRDRFFDVLREITEDGRSVLVFTEYTDTQEYLRDHLQAHYDESLGCYNGGGGLLPEDGQWEGVTKDMVTQRLKEGKLRVLICTDAASQGLNLQAAGAVINYDLPWNPSRVEQRIGRIDRIGQKHSQVLVVNLFLKNSVDDQVYHVLRRRCGLFEHFVGPMQPVLARARRMLMGQEQVDLSALRSAATEVERDPLATEIYFQSPAEQIGKVEVAVTRQDLVEALGSLSGDIGSAVKSGRDRELFEISGSGIRKVKLAASVQDLEHDHGVRALSPTEPVLLELRKILERPGERLPLVIGSSQKRQFRASVAIWTDDVGNHLTINSVAKLRQKLEGWTGDYPKPASWQQAKEKAQQLAEKCATQLEQRASKRDTAMLQRQLQAAKVRLQRELGRYLVSVDGGAGDLNDLLYKQTTRDIATATRLKKCLERLGGYPKWDPELRQELAHFARELTANKRKGRLIGRELDAALSDPRWQALPG